MNSAQQASDVCVVGGAGHVGAPLSIVLAKSGLRTRIYDINANWIALLSAGQMPFSEHGSERVLREVLETGRLTFTTSAAGVRDVPYVIITIGTPIDEFHNPVVRVITDCLDTLLPHLSDSQTLILRSTVFPGVTDFIHRYVHSHGKRVKVAFCPERVVQGHAIKEIQTLPQIVSGTTPEAVTAATELFSRIAPQIVPMLPMEAEFAKLLCNAYRYIQFAATNQFYMMVEAAGLDYSRVLAGLKADYPRARDLPGPGFAAGPCLMKDTMQLFAFSNHHFLLGHAAMLANEGLPSFIVENLRKRYDLTRTRVGILGMAFKADIDDTRESLSYKLGKILRFHGATMSYSDEFAQDATFVSKEELLSSSDVVIIGVPHTAYRQLTVPQGVEIVDLWNIVPERAALQRAA